MILDLSASACLEHVPLIFFHTLSCRTTWNTNTAKPFSKNEMKRGRFKNMQSETQSQLSPQPQFCNWWTPTWLKCLTVCIVRIALFSYVFRSIIVHPYKQFSLTHTCSELNMTKSHWKVVATAGTHGLAARSPNSQVKPTSGSSTSTLLRTFLQDRREEHIHPST